MAEDNELLREIRDLLRLIAEPELAKRDERFRASLRQIVGKSKRKAEAVALMDGSRSRATIQKECGIDVGDLSRLNQVMGGPISGNNTTAKAKPQGGTKKGPRQGPSK
jgi:hypothetical protein